jgi:hypothetical protein
MSHTLLRGILLGAAPTKGYFTPNGKWRGSGLSDQESPMAHLHTLVRAVPLLMACAMLPACDRDESIGGNPSVDGVNPRSASEPDLSILNGPPNRGATTRPVGAAPATTRTTTEPATAPAASETAPATAPETTPATAPGPESAPASFPAPAGG